MKAEGMRGGWPGGARVLPLVPKEVHRIQQARVDHGMRRFPIKVPDS